MPESITAEQARAERKKFEDELKTILNACENAGVLARVLGSMAFQIRCPHCGYLQTEMGLVYSDINLAAYVRDGKQIREILKKLGYTENREIYALSEAHRAIFYKNDLSVDIFFDQLDFNHLISWKGRLAFDSSTIPLAELLLEKLQIVQISERDIINIVMLLLEYPLGEIDERTINVKQIAVLCAEEWGLWRTVTINLNKAKQFAAQYEKLNPEQKSKVDMQVKDILLRLYAEPKPLAWKVRDHMGDRVKWYKDVDDS